MWQGSARTNFARFTDIEQLKKVCEANGVVVTLGPENFACLEPSDAAQDGDFPGVVEDEATGDDVEFMPDLVAPLLQPGSVLVSMTCGADKLRYLTGVATAYTRDDNGEVQLLQVSMNDIYEKAATAFKVDVRDIGECHYEDLPANYRAATSATAAADCAAQEDETEGAATERCK